MNNLAVRLGREDRFVDLLERLAELSPSAGDAVRVEAACSHEVFSHPSYFRVLTHRWPGVRFVAAGLDGAPRRLAAGLGVAYASPAAPEGERDHAARESLLSHNFTFWEYLAYELRRKAARVRSPWGRRPSGSSRWRQWALPGLVFFAVAAALGSVASYAFVTRTVVTLVPQSVARTAAANLTFAQDPGVSTQRSVPVRAVERTVSLSRAFAVTGFDAATAPRASGLADLTNETGTGLRLRPSTRLVAPGGQVFRLPAWTDIPAGATLRVRVESDPGSSPSVASGTLFSLPGLGELRDKAWARAAQDFTGSSAPASPVFSQKDLDSGLADLRDDLLAAATEAVSRQLEAEDARDPLASWAVLPAAGAVTVASFTGSASSVPGDRVASASFSGTLSVRALAYDRATAQVYLKSALFDRLLADRERFVALQPASLRVAYEFARSPDPFRLRATVEMDATVAYTLSDLSGPKSLAVRQEIAGKSAQEASAFLLANPEIATVSISSTPFWAEGVAPDPRHVSFSVIRP